MDRIIASMNAGRVAGGRGLCRRGCGAAVAALIETRKEGGARTVDTLC